MRYLLITDIHANLEALEAVLDDSPAYDAVVCLGDIVGYGGSPNECVALVRALPGLICLKGNHDLAALGEIDVAEFNDYARTAAVWTGNELSPEAKTWLGHLESWRSLPDWYLAHASPRDPVWEYMESEDQGPPNFSVFQQRLCFVGHTHVPRIFYESDGLSRTPVSQPKAGETLQLRQGSRAIVNPGGVGQPRDRDPRAAYGIVDAESAQITFCRVQYPIEVAQRKILEAGLPEPLARRLSIGV
jgi:diadenosine tetraphosphatase ApaH/serine/threonine PP2A family protein phosphatase